MNITKLDETDSGISSPDPDEILSPDNEGKAECPKCHKRFKVTAAGALRSHKCTETPAVVRSTRRATRGGRKSAPESVKRLGNAAIASGVEWSSGAIVSRAVPCARHEIPDAIITVPDADVMIGPFIDELWPSLPVGVQKTLVKLADREDLIAACFAWFEYFQTLRAWADAESARKDKTNEQQPISQATPVVGESVDHYAAFTPAREAM